jgi:2-polyprenyl-3-methyl-5-hydroxy-6-metoxy-1,4-benzoquinol methylase
MSKKTAVNGIELDADLARKIVSLQAARIDAAIRSEGTSSEKIYEAIRNIVRSQKTAGRVLDFGAGTGALTKWLISEKIFAEVHAADITPQPEGLSGISNWIQIDLNLEIPSANDTYDLVVAAEVIEHLENPRFVCREVFRLLRPGGLVVITTPNNEHVRSILSLMMRGHFAAFTGGNYPAHITALLRCDIGRILAEAGFKEINFSYSESGSVPLTTITWQQTSFGALRGKRFSDNIIVTAYKPIGS